MKKRYQDGGPIDEMEEANKEAGLNASKGKNVGFFERMRMGNIDQPGTEAYNKYGAGRARSSAPVPETSQLTPRKVSIGDAAYEDERAKKRAMERSREMQQDISAGTDFVNRPQDEGYRPYISPKDRATAEGEKDAGKITESGDQGFGGPGSSRVVKATPTALPKDQPAPKKPAYVQRYTEEMMEADNPRSVKAEKAPAVKPKPAVEAPTKTSSSRVPTSEQASANRAVAAEKIKGMGSSIADYFSTYETPAERKAKERKEKAAKGSYSSGGSVRSASNRGDGIAQRGKTRGKMY